MKFVIISLVGLGVGSHPARGAWVEINRIYHASREDRVAPRKGCVG